MSTTRQEFAYSQGIPTINTNINDDFPTLAKAYASVDAMLVDLRAQTPNSSPVTSVVFEDFRSTACGSPIRAILGMHLGAGQDGDACEESAYLVFAASAATPTAQTKRGVELYPAYTAIWQAGDAIETDGPLDAGYGLYYTKSVVVTPSGLLAKLTNAEVQAQVSGGTGLLLIPDVGPALGILRVFRSSSAGDSGVPATSVFPRSKLWA